MCTALSIRSKEGNTFFGRNMDIEYVFGQSVMVVPKNYKYRNEVTGEMVTNQRGFIGMGTIIDNHPAMADAMNESGLACASLNFAGYAHYEKTPVEGKNNIAPYDFIQWVVSGHDTVEEVKEAIKDIELVSVPIKAGVNVVNLHWMIGDSTGQLIVVEKTIDGIKIYDNKVGVMTNNPTFDWQLTNLNEYVNLTEKHPEESKWGEHSLNPLGVGIGTRGIPGDFGSVSRFVRIAYIRAKTPELPTDGEAVTQFFHMLDYVKMIKGGVVTKEGIDDTTLYISCMDQKNGVYYYKTYNNSRINAIKILDEDINGDEVKVYPYKDTQDISYQN